MCIQQQTYNQPQATYLDGVWLAGVDAHAHSETTEDRRALAVRGCQLGAFRVLQQLIRPEHQQQAMLYIQGPGNGIYWVMESHGEGIALCGNLHMSWGRCC